jgi:hypothetical protein
MCGFRSVCCGFILLVLVWDSGCSAVRMPENYSVEVSFLSTDFQTTQIIKAACHPHASFDIEIDDTGGTHYRISGLIDGAHDGKLYLGYFTVETKNKNELNKFSFSAPASVDLGKWSYLPVSNVGTDRQCGFIFFTNVIPPSAKPLTTH